MPARRILARAASAVQLSFGCADHRIRRAAWGFLHRATLEQATRTRRTAVHCHRGMCIAGATGHGGTALDSQAGSHQACWRRAAIWTSPRRRRCNATVTGAAPSISLCSDFPLLSVAYGRWQPYLSGPGRAARLRAHVRLMHPHEEAGLVLRAFIGPAGQGASVWNMGGRRPWGAEGWSLAPCRPVTLFAARPRTPESRKLGAAKEMAP